MIPQRIAERDGKLVPGHRLLNDLMTLPVSREVVRTQAGREQDRHASLGKDICNRENHLATEIHVEKGKIDAFMALSQIGSPPDIASRADDLATELQQHVLEQKAYHRVVLNQEDAKASEFFDRRHVAALRVCP
jgi:hypothetical protein